MPKKLTTDEFILKAKKVHGDTYAYQRSVYKNATSKVTITCRIHGDFDQVACYHTSGNGCPTCGGTQRSTKAEFVATANDKYDYKYDYSDFEYISRKTKGKILCPDHGEFWQTPGGHLAPHVVSGCPKCGLETLGNAIRKSQENFEADARAKHGEKFEYGVYSDSHTPMAIICPSHGCFEMTPNAHLRSAYGCRACATVTNEDFIHRADEVHKGFYSYGKTEYEASDKPIIVTCPVHGDFGIRAGNHLNGSGCSYCWSEKNNGGHEPFTFEGGSYNSIDELCGMYGIEENSRVAFKRRMQNIRMATEEEIRAQLDHIYMPRDKEIVCHGITYPTLKEFYGAVQPVASIQTVGRWLRQGLTPEQVIDIPTTSNPHKSGCVYKIMHIQSGRSYIGQTTSSIERRWAEHCYAASQKASTKLTKAIRKYGPDAFTIVVLFTDIETGAALDALETELIAQYNTVKKGLNTLQKGKGGRNRGKPTNYKGMTYPTAKMAAEAMADAEDITASAAEYRIRNGVTKSNIKLSYSKATDIRKALKAGAGRGELAEQYGVSIESIRNIALGRTWKEPTNTP